MPGVRALIVTPLGVSEREDNNPVPPGVRGIRPQSRFILPTVALKSILPKRARVSLAAEAGGIEAFKIVSVILPVARTLKPPPAVIPVLPFVAIEAEPDSTVHVHPLELRVMDDP